MTGILIFLVLLAAGYSFGRAAEKSHLVRLEDEEGKLGHIRLASVKKLSPELEVDGEGVLVYGSVVIATDYFKVIISGLRNLLGGNLPEFESLLIRSRREATVRMMRMADEHGTNLICNVRVETSTLGGQQTKNPGGSEVFVYGTAYRVR